MITLIFKVDLLSLSIFHLTTMGYFLPKLLLLAIIYSLSSVMVENNDLYLEGQHLHPLQGNAGSLQTKD